MEEERGNGEERENDGEYDEGIKWGNGEERENGWEYNGVSNWGKRGEMAGNMMEELNGEW